MAEHGLSLLFAIALWWASTGVILMLGALPRRTFIWSMLAATVTLCAALYGIAHSANDESVAGAYVAFLSAIAIWGWIEMSFLMGFVTGPRTLACPVDARGWTRFRLAAQTLIYHEVAILAGAGAIVGLTWGAPNQVGTLAFLILMGMRISAKLNLFLGVPNITDEFIPDHLAYLKSYFRKRPANAFFPVAIAASATAAFILMGWVVGADDGGGQAVGAMLLFTLLMLGILEHVFMVLPLGDAALWRWAVSGSSARDRRGAGR